MFNITKPITRRAAHVARIFYNQKNGTRHRNRGKMKTTKFRWYGGTRVKIGEIDGVALLPGVKYKVEEFVKVENHV